MMQGEQKEPIVFRCENSLWQMMATGEKSFDFRRWDISDDRIYRLAWGQRVKEPEGGLSYWEPKEPLVSFENKKTGEVLVFSYQGMEFTSWAPGWVFLLLGGLVRRELIPH